MPHYQFPLNYIYWEKIKEHEELKRELLPIINKLQKNASENPFSLCKMTTSFADKNTFLNNDNIDKIVWKPIDNMIKEIETLNPNCSKIEPIHSFVHLYWYNYYNKGDFQEMHNHMCCSREVNGMIYYPSFCLIYILNDEGSENKTSFLDYTTGNAPFNTPFSKIYNTGNNKDINEGSVIIFSPNLMHGVAPIEKSGRITIAFNVYSTFKNS